MSIENYDIRRVIPKPSISGDMDSVLGWLLIITSYRVENLVTFTQAENGDFNTRPTSKHFCSMKRGRFYIPQWRGIIKIVAYDNSGEPLAWFTMFG